MEAGAPLIHPDQMSYERAQVTGLMLNPVPDSSISYHYKFRRDDVEAVWSQCDLVVEDTFSTQFVQYAHLEPHVTIALYDATGVLALGAGEPGREISLATSQAVLAPAEPPDGARQALVANHSCSDWLPKDSDDG